MRKIEKYPFVKGDRGVYRIVFNDTWFYIGSSVDLYRRQGNWLQVFRSAYWLCGGNSKMLKIRPLVTVIRFDYIEKTTIDVNEKEIETQYLQQYSGNEFLLNRDLVAYKANRKPIKPKNNPTG